ESHHGAPLVLFALPDDAERRNHFEVAIPKLGSLIVTRDPNGFVEGLDAHEGNHPRVAPVFWSFRIMVGMGLVMIAVAFWGVWNLWRHSTQTLPRRLLQVLVALT